MKADTSIHHVCSSVRQHTASYKEGHDRIVLVSRMNNIVSQSYTLVHTLLKNLYFY